MTVRLLSCETGANNNGVAQQLANILNETVIAPNRTIVIRPDGTVILEPPSIPIPFTDYVIITKPLLSGIDFWAEWITVNPSKGE